MRKKENIIIFCAHSDDQIIGAGGTLAKYAKEGKNVYTVICDYEERSFFFLKEDATNNIRINSSKKANKIIGGKDIFVLKMNRNDFDDKVKKILKKLKPSKIFVHSPQDLHIAHKAVHRKIMQILNEIKYRGDIFYYDVWNFLPSNVKNTSKIYIDISKTFPIKMKALRCFNTEWTSFICLLRILFLDPRINGFHANKRYSERFLKVR